MVGDEVDLVWEGNVSTDAFGSTIVPGASDPWTEGWEDPWRTHLSDSPQQRIVSSPAGSVRCLIDALNGTAGRPCLLPRRTRRWVSDRLAMAGLDLDVNRNPLAPYGDGKVTGWRTWPRAPCRSEGMMGAGTLAELYAMVERRLSVVLFEEYVTESLERVLSIGPTGVFDAARRWLHDGVRPDTRYEDLTRFSSRVPKDLLDNYFLQAILPTFSQFDDDTWRAGARLYRQASERQRGLFTSLVPRLLEAVDRHESRWLHARVGSSPATAGSRPRL